MFIHLISYILGNSDFTSHVCANRLCHLPLITVWEWRGEIILLDILVFLPFSMFSMTGKHVTNHQVFTLFYYMRKLIYLLFVINLKRKAFRFLAPDLKSTIGPSIS